MEVQVKQGRASSNTDDGRHVNPINKPVNPAATDQLGRALGNWAKDKTLPGAKVPLYRADGGQAPLITVKIHHNGSQGRR